MKTNDKTTKGATKNNTHNNTHDSACAMPGCGASPRMQKLLASLAPGELVSINVDVASVAQTAFSVVPVMRALRGRVLELLPGTNMERYDAFEELAQTLCDAHTRYMVATSEGDGLAELHSEGVELRGLLSAETVPMVKRGLLSEQQVRACTMGLGAQGVGFDLQAQQCMLRAIWPSIKDRSGVTLKELDRAGELGLLLVKGRAGRENREALLAEKGSERQKWFSLLVREYREVQRVMTYLRWSEGDADELAPSLWAKSGATRRKKEEPKGDEGENAGGAKG